VATLYCQSGAARSPHCRVLADARRAGRDPSNEPARRRRVRDDPRPPDQDWSARDRAHRAHPYPTANRLPGRGIVPNRSTWPAPIRPVSSGASRPKRAAGRGRSTPNASYSEWHHTDPAGRTASARSLNRPEICATSCIIAAPDQLSDRDEIILQEAIATALVFRIKSALSATPPKDQEALFAGRSKRAGDMGALLRVAAFLGNEDMGLFLADACTRLAAHE
jgi:hypothetical protein